MSPPTPPPLTPEQLAIIAAYQAFSAAVAGPTVAGLPPAPIPTRPQPTITDIQPRQGPVNTTVTITGSELDTATEVFVGNQPAINVRPAATEVTFDVPAGAVAVPAKIAVRTSLGVALSTQDFTVTVP
jgi:IPT/TIG domain